MLAWFTKSKPQKGPQEEPDPSERVLVVSFDFDLTRPDSKRLEVGSLKVRGDEFVRFDWFMDPEAVAAQHRSPLVGPMIRSLPATLRSVASQWPAYRNRSVPEWRKGQDPKTLADYYCMVFGQHSSIFISGVRPIGYQRS